MHERAGHYAGVSIHAPTRGATVARPDRQRIGVVSIHAPTRGATVYAPLVPSTQRVSIHAPTRGATHSTAGL